MITEATPTNYDILRGKLFTADSARYAIPSPPSYDSYKDYLESILLKIRGRARKGKNELEVIEAGFWTRIWYGLGFEKEYNSLLQKELKIRGFEVRLVACSGRVTKLIIQW